MSIGSWTSIAVARDSRAPTKADAGRTVSGAEDAGSTASVPDLLGAMVPTALVGLYTAATALIIGLIPEPTEENPNPDELYWARWAVFVLLILATPVLVFVQYRGKRVKNRRRFPFLEMIGATVAAIGWALILPQPPLEKWIGGTSAAAVPIVVAFGTGVVGSIIAIAAQKPVVANQGKTTRENPVASKHGAKQS